MKAGLVTILASTGKMPNIRKFKDRVTIQSKVKVKDEGGGRSTSWVDEETVWAWIEAGFNVTQTKEAWNGDQLEPVSVYKVRIRYNSNMNSTKRFKVVTQLVNGQPRILNPRSCVDEMGRKSIMILFCDEVIGGDGTP